MSHPQDQSTPNYRQAIAPPIALRPARTCSFSTCSESMPSTLLPLSNALQFLTATTTQPLFQAVSIVCVRQFAPACHHESQTLCMLQPTSERLRLACCTCTERFPTAQRHMLQQTTPMLHMVPSALPVLSASTNSGLQSVRHGLYFGK